MNQMDNDKNGRIDFDEFLSGLRFLSWLVEVRFSTQVFYPMLER
jgi:Ca2+-binding EF-hand superfamily protein